MLSCLHTYKKSGLLAAAVICLFSCSPDAALKEATQVEQLLPPGFPPITYPSDNTYNEDRIALGKELFFDPILSVDSSISCSSCHKPEWAFADHVAVSAGVEGRLGTRNSPTLANVAYLPYTLMDGGNPTLEFQVFVPIEEHVEMGFNMVLLTERLQANPYYKSRFEEVFGELPSPFGITRSIVAFERTLLSGQSTYDLFLQGKTGMSAAAIRGRDLFYSYEVGCGNCHSSFNFTNWAFENNGLYEVYYPDSGRARITRLPEDVGKFKVPTLRNIALTYPYMHDGSLPDLEAVIEHYNSGGSNHINKSTYIKPLGLTDVQKEDIILFLESLTDVQFANEEAWKD